MSTKLLLNLIDSVFEEYKLIDNDFLKKRNYILNLFKVIDFVEMDQHTYKLNYFNPKFYIHLRNKKNMVDYGDYIIERLFINSDDEIYQELQNDPKLEKELTDYYHFQLFNKYYNSYTIKEIIDIYNEDYGYTEEDGKIIYDSFILTNDPYLLNTCMYAINIDELLKICKYEYDNKKIRLNVDSFGIKSDDFLKNVIKVICNYNISSATNYTEDWIKDDGKTYYSGVYCEGWFHNKYFDFLKTPDIYKDSYKNEILSLKDYEKTTILYFHQYLLDDIFSVFTDPIYWESTKKGYKYYDTENKIRIYINSIDELKELFEGKYLKYIKIKTRIDYNLYIEYFIENWTYVGYLSPDEIYKELFFKEISEDEIKYYSDSNYRNKIDKLSSEESIELPPF